MKPSNVRTTVIAGACALVGAAGGIAGVSAATDNGSSSGSSGSDQQTLQDIQSQGTQQAAPPQGGPGAQGGPPPGPHRGANGQQEKPLTGETAAKVKAAALDKVDGEVVRVETDVDHGSPYEAHVQKSDGTQVEVLVDKDFKVTATNEMRHP
jgi:uncharacterized membrane protein YkoI